MQQVRILLLLILPPVFSGCGEDGPFELQSEAGSARFAMEGLVQEIRLNPALPRPGDTLWISSQVTLASPLSRMVEYRICGIDYQSELKLPLPPTWLVCAGYSARGPLTPADTLRDAHVGVVSSPPGLYRVRLRHVLDPEMWVELDVHVVED